MSVIRVSRLPRRCTEKEIKIHFSKDEHGGGRIQSLYYPMFNGDAVVLFVHRDTADRVLAVEDQLLNGSHSVDVTKLPALQAYPTLEARLDPTVAALLQVDHKIREAISYHFYNDNVEFIRDKDDKIDGIRGNWYLLEWTWAHIDNYVKHQSGNKYDESRTVFTETQGRDYGEKMEDDAPLNSLPSGTSNTDTKNIRSSGTEPTKLKKDSAIRQDEAEVRTKYLDTPVTVHATDNQIVIKGDTEDISSLNFVLGPLTVSVYIGWITKAETDAIVNAAMGSLANGGGVAYAIAKAASSEMQRQCDDYVKIHGSLSDGEAMHTCAGGDISNQVKYIIHAVGPMYVSGLQDRCSALLTRTFLNCLKYANDHLKINTVTMPLISSGIFGVPLEICVQSFLNAIVLFRDECDTVCLREVHLVNNNANNTALTVLQLRSLISQGADKLITDAKLLLSSTSTTITSYAGSHLVEPGISSFDEENVTKRTSPTKADYSTGSHVVRVSGQKWSTEFSSLHGNVDFENKSRLEELATRPLISRNYQSTDGASGCQLPSATSESYISSFERQRSPIERSSGPPTTKYLYSAEGTSGLGLSSASHGHYKTIVDKHPTFPGRSYGSPTTNYLYSAEGTSGLGLSSASHGHYKTIVDKHPTFPERISGQPTTLYNTFSSKGSSAMGLSFAARSMYSPHTTSQTRHYDLTRYNTVGRPLPDTTSKRY